MCALYSYTRNKFDVAPDQDLAGKLLDLTQKLQSHFRLTREVETGTM